MNCSKYYNNVVDSKMLYSEGVAYEMQEAMMDKRRAFQRATAVVKAVSPNPKYVVGVCIGPVEVKCDLELLQQSSRYFSRASHKMVIGLPVHRVSLEAFLLIYKWMARPSYVVPSAMLQGFFNAAVYLEIDVLMDQFVDEFMAMRYAREETGFYMFYTMHKAQLHTEYPRHLRVHKFFLTLICTEEFKQLCPQTLAALLHSDTICVNAEIEVLIAALIWLHHDYDERKSYIPVLLGCIHFEEIPFDALMEMREDRFVPGPADILDKPEVWESIRSSPLVKYQIGVPSTRIWISDPICKYHHDANCHRRNFVTWPQFEAFKLAVRGAKAGHWWYRQHLNPYAPTCRRKVCRDQRSLKQQRNTNTLKKKSSLIEIILN